jgi:hypothetical protein
MNELRPFVQDIIRSVNEQKRRLSSPPKKGFSIKWPRLRDGSSEGYGFMPGVYEVAGAVTSMALELAGS